MTEPAAPDAPRGTAADHPMGRADISDFQRLSTPLPDHAQDVFLLALDAARAYEAGGRPTAGTYSADRIGHVVQAILDAGYLTPADTPSRIERIRGEAHHHLNPLIGWLRLRVGGGGSQALDNLSDANVIARLVTTLDAVDAAAGHRPMREELDDMQARIANRRATQAPGA